MKSLMRCTIVGLAASALFAGVSHAGGKGTVVELGNLKATTPASWKMQEASNKFRIYQFQVPKAKDDKEDAEMVVFYFEGSGGSALENIKRWKGMFDPPKGKSIDDVSSVDAFKVGSAEITYLDVHGTYLSKFPPFAPNAKTIRKPDYRMLGIYLACDKGPFFIRLTGPANTVEAHKKDFDAWLKALK